jgi:hypothetical protein
MNNSFSKYYLKENPFPETPVIDPLSSDMRLNGEIFNEHIFQNEIDNLKKKTQQGINVIYLAGIQFDRGIGKSALMINHMRRLTNLPETACAYVRCCEKEKPRDAVRKVIEQWHLCGYLWETFKKAFTAYAKAKNDILLTPDSVESLFKSNQNIPEKLPLSLYTHTRDTSKVKRSFSLWISENYKVNSPSMEILAADYLTLPQNFTDSIKSKTVDIFALYETLSRFLNAFGYKKSYIFLDQFEDMIMGTSKSSINKLALEMKSFIRTSSGYATLFVTLHPNSEMSLRVPAAQDMTGLAPLDAVHRIDVMVLDTKGNSAISLAEEYFKCFRTEGAIVPYSTYPFEPEVLEFICYLNRGLIRGFLEQLHNSLDYGANNELKEITFQFAKEHPLEIFGKEIDQRIYDNFYVLKGKTVDHNSNRGMGKLIQDFKRSESTI